MGIDPRQIVAGVLTVTMFLMLGNMIKRDHFDAPISHHVCFFLSLLLLPIHCFHIRNRPLNPFIIHSDPFIC